MVKKKTKIQSKDAVNLSQGLSVISSILLVLYVAIYPIIDGDHLLDTSRSSLISFWGRGVNEILFLFGIIPIFILSLILAYGLASRKDTDGFNVTYNTILYGIGIGILALIPFYGLNFLLNFSL